MERNNREESGFESDRQLEVALRGKVTFQTPILLPKLSFPSGWKGNNSVHLFVDVIGTAAHRISQGVADGERYMSNGACQWCGPCLRNRLNGKKAKCLTLQ